MNCPATARSRFGVIKSVQAIVPCRYSPAPTTPPRTSVSRPLKPAVAITLRTLSSVGFVSSATESTTMRRTSAAAAPARPQNVRVVRSFSSSAPTSLVIGQPPSRR
jgi:hypothetical protein